MPPPIDEKQIPLKERYWTQRFVRCFAAAMPLPLQICQQIGSIFLLSKKASNVTDACRGRDSNPYRLFQATGF